MDKAISDNFDRQFRQLLEQTSTGGTTQRRQLPSQEVAPHNPRSHYRPRRNNHNPAVNHYLQVNVIVSHEGDDRKFMFVYPTITRHHKKATDIAIRKAKEEGWATIHRTWVDIL